MVTETPKWLLPAPSDIIHEAICWYLTLSMVIFVVNDIFNIARFINWFVSVGLI
ncbi:hypothetical protein [Ureibacillus acetophenoni]